MVFPNLEDIVEDIVEQVFLDKQREDGVYDYESLPKVPPPSSSWFQIIFTVALSGSELPQVGSRSSVLTFERLALIEFHNTAGNGSICPRYSSCSATFGVLR